MDTSFWIITIGSAALTVFGVGLATWSAIKSHNESVRDKAHADSVTKAHQKLLQKNYDASIAIIDSLETASQHAKVLMETSNATLQAQKSSSEELVKQTTANIKTQRLIERSGKDLVDTVEKVREQIKDQMLGGNSFIEMRILRMGQQAIPQWMAIIHGSNPVRDISVRVVDLNLSGTIQEMMNNEQHLNLAALYPGSSQLTPERARMDTDRGVNLNIFIAASNGFTVQLLRMRYVHGNWVQATRIMRQDHKNGAPPLYEGIDTNYPIKDKDLIFKDVITKKSE